MSRHGHHAPLDGSPLGTSLAVAKAGMNLTLHQIQLQSHRGVPLDAVAALAIKRLQRCLVLAGQR